MTTKQLFLLIVLGIPFYGDSFRSLQDDCGASMLSFDDDDLLLVVGSNSNATEDVLSCTASYRQAVFYQFVATGARYRISTCHSQTMFATDLVFGTGNCGDVGCTDIETFPDSECDAPASVVEFFSQEDETYTIAVMGNDTGVVGDFGLTIQQFRRPQNDVCSGSETLQPGTSSDPILFASTENATANVLSCEAEEQVGVYYDFVGTGARFRVSTCHAATTFNSRLVVSDSQCLDIGCGTPYESIIEDDCDVAPGKGYSMEFRSEEGVNYTIGVRGTNGLEDRGDFGLTLLEYVRPENDVCIKPTPITLEDGKAFISRSTENSTTTQLSCYAEAYPTAFFEVIGTGELLYLSTCFTPSFNTSILVDQGKCDGAFSGCGSDISLADFTCDPDNGYATTLSTSTVEGETYTIAVLGVAPSERGDFSLQVQMGGGELTIITNTSGNSSEGADKGEEQKPTSGKGRAVNGLFFGFLGCVIILLG